MKIVSVIIPTCRRPDNLKRAIQSVFNQSYKSIEIIVIDDNGIGSEFQKETENLVQPYLQNTNFIYFPLPQNMGAAFARNKGIEISKGDYIAFLDDDDEYLSNKIIEQVNRLESLEPIYGACYCRQQYIVNDNLYIVNDSYSEGDLTKDILNLSNHVNTSCLLFRKCVLEKINGFNTNLVRHEDWDLLLRFFVLYKIALDTSGYPLLNRHIGSVSFAPVGYELVIRQDAYINQFLNYINLQNDRNKILKIQWAFVYKELFRQNYVYLGLKIAIRAHRYYPLNFREWKWVGARFIKNLFKSYKQNI